MTIYIEEYLPKHFTLYFISSVWYDTDDWSLSAPPLHKYAIFLFRPKHLWSGGRCGLVLHQFLSLLLAIIYSFPTVGLWQGNRILHNHYWLLAVDGMITRGYGAENHENCYANFIAVTLGVNPFRWKEHLLGKCHMMIPLSCQNRNHC